MMNKRSEEAETFPDDESPRQGIHNVLSMREEMPGFGRLRSSYRTWLETCLFESGGMP